MPQRSIVSRDKFARTIVSACLVIWLGAEVSFADELLTFEDGRLDEQFEAEAGVELRRWTPESVVGLTGHRPEGNALRLTAQAGNGAITKARVLEAIDWRKVESLGLWLHRTAEEAKDHPIVEVEFRLIEADQKSYFWRRLEVTHVGWQKVILPLDWFVWSNARIPCWENVRHLGVRLRHAGAVTLDTVWTKSEKFDRDEFLDANEVLQVAFPKAERSNEAATSDRSVGVRSLETRDVQLLTNADSLELERLAAHMGLAAKQVRMELPFLREPDRGPLLIVFQSSDEYRQFVPRLGRQFNLQIGEAESAGHTLEGVGASSWSDKYGSLRPVYVHEFLHGYLTRSARLPLRGDWLHEGLSTHFQLRLHPQVDWQGVITEGLSSPGRHFPLNELCDGRTIPTSRYWQAAILCRMLLTDPRYQSGVPYLFKRLSDAESVDLGPHLATVWQTDWNRLTDEWRKYCEKVIDTK